MQRLRVLAASLAAVIFPVMQATPGQAEPAGSVGRTQSLDPTDTVVEYTFIGSSVAPAYHKEYAIIAKSGSIEIKVGSYGTVAGQADPQGQDSKPLDASAWQHILSLADKLPAEAERPRTMPGGTSQEATVKVGDTTVKHGYRGNAEADELGRALQGFFDIEHLLT